MPGVVLEDAGSARGWGGASSQKGQKVKRSRGRNGLASSRSSGKASRAARADGGLGRRRSGDRAGLTSGAMPALFELWVLFWGDGKPQEASRGAVLFNLALDSRLCRREGGSQGALGVCAEVLKGGGRVHREKHSDHTRV